MIVDRTIWHIEMQLAEPMTNTDLASKVGISPFHLARTFASATGHTPANYIRKRRLSEAAKALAFGTNDILTIALDAQYGSHEAFTRAFQAQFNVRPKDVRASQSFEAIDLTEPFTMERSRLVDVAAPTLTDRDAFTVVGPSIRCTFEDTSEIPTLWRKFNEREDEVADTPNAAYGVCFAGDDKGFSYLAGMEPSPGKAIPDGMQSLAIPAQKYAVFTHSGHISDLPKTVYSIWNKALADAGLTPAKGPDFELYDTRFNVETGRGDVDIWIPVAKS